MNYTKHVNSYGSELWDFNVAGVSYPNDDGTERQEIISQMIGRSNCTFRLERYVYQGIPAYHVIADGQTIGNVPKNIASEFAAKDDTGYWLAVISAGVHGGPNDDYDDDDDGEPHYYGVHMTVKLISPTEQKIKQITVDDDGFAHEYATEDIQSAPQESPPVQQTQAPPQNQRKGGCGCGLKIFLWIIVIAIFANAFTGRRTRRNYSQTSNETILNANEPDGQRVLEKQESTAKAQDTKPQETVAPKEIEIPAEYPDPVRFTGSGDDVLSINCPDYPFAFYITGNSDSRHFSVITYDSDGNYSELLVNTSEPYSGFTFDPSQDVAKIEVSATGSWEIQLRSIYDVGSIAAGSSFNGVGDTVLLIRSCGDSARINGNAGGNHFAVWTYGADNDLLVNTTDVYNGTVVMPCNPVLLVVTAVGEWSVTLSE